MRPQAALAGLLCFALALPLLGSPSAAHNGPGFPHVNPSTLSLAPGQEQRVELTFTEGDTGGNFEAGWVFVLNLQLWNGSGPLDAVLQAGHAEHPNATAATWHFPGAGAQHVTAGMPATDVYTLTFRNPAATGSNATFSFFYDQSCNCAAKPIPPTDLQGRSMPGGVVIFNADVKKGAQWDAQFFEPAVHTLRVDLAKRTNATSHWPEDFHILESSTQAKLVPPAARQHEFNWTADETTRYYFIVQSTAADLSRFDPADPGPGVMVIPNFEQVKAGDADVKPSPGFEVAAMALALAGALALTRLRG